jgi:betaine lipid synthase
LGWFTRWFWAIWFDSDNVYLTPGRREYLEHKFKTVKTISAINHMIKPFVRIPYYVWVGAQKAQFPSMANFSLDGTSPILIIGNPQQVKDAPISQLETPEQSERQDALSDIVSDDEEDVIETSAAVTKKHVYHVSNDHVHGQGYRWRQHFDPALLDRFSTYLYAFTWEDPRVDLQFLNLTTKDHMFVISSGGCNVLEYAIKVGPERIHAVDLNPCQNHMLELKLAAINSLCYEDYWKLLGEGMVVIPSLYRFH